MTPLGQSTATVERIRTIARDYGYAVAVHGSQTRDLDLIAVPWTEGAAGSRALVDALVERGPFVFGSLTGRPHGRIGYVLHGAAGFEYIDLSVLPRVREDVAMAYTRDFAAMMNEARDGS